MNAVTEIDKSGRMVLPKKIRDAMHLRAGDRLTVEFLEDKLVIAPERHGQGLHLDRGWLVFDNGASRTGAMSEQESLEQIEIDRMDFLLGEREKNLDLH